MKLAIYMDAADMAYISRIKRLIGEDVSGVVITKIPDYKFEMLAELRTREFTDCLILSSRAAECLLGTKVKEPDTMGGGLTMTDLLGSFRVEEGINFLFMTQLRVMIASPYGELLQKTHIKKLLAPESYVRPTQFRYKVIQTVQDYTTAYEFLSSCNFIALDIETGSGRIECISFAGFKNHESISYVIDIKHMDAYEWMKSLCLLDVPKVTHNGMYDMTHLISWGCPATKWYFDTYALFHSTYSELPRTLAFVTAFYIKDSMYWKDEGKTGNREDYLRYNARDTWATGNAFLAMMRDIPDYARTNYKIKFPEIAPCVLCGLEGVAVDSELKYRLIDEQVTILEENFKSIKIMLGENFNPNSPKQMGLLLKLLTGKIQDSSDAKTISRISEQNPLAARILSTCTDYKKARKLLSTYVEARLYGNRYLYAINPFGTDTGRMAASQSHLFIKDGSKYLHYGQQVQNLPPYVKNMLVADEGFLLCEIDKKASESYCTAALSRDEKLWDVIHNSPDFHCTNASLFFGIPFELLFDTASGKVLNKDIRTLAKRVNHGANYNMGANVLVDTMGDKKIWESRTLLLAAYKERLLEGYDANIYRLYSAILQCKVSKDIGAFLLDRFHEAYPRIKSRWYGEIALEVTETKKLASPSGWTRVFMGDARNDKLALNSAIAHGPQHLSVALLNIGFRKIFDTLQGANFKLKAQIHDSVFFQYRIGHEHLVHEANDMLMGEITVHGKTLLIPNDATYGQRVWGNLK